MRSKWALTHPKHVASVFTEIPRLHSQMQLSLKATLPCFLAGPVTIVTVLECPVCLHVYVCVCVLKMFSAVERRCLYHYVGGFYCCVLCFRGASPLSEVLSSSCLLRATFLFGTTICFCFSSRVISTVKPLAATGYKQGSIDQHSTELITFILYYYIFMYIQVLPSLLFSSHF